MISPRTTERITEIAARLGYDGNAALRARLQRQRTIGLVLPSIHHSHYYGDASLLHDVLSDEGYKIVLACHHHDPELEEPIIRSLLEHPVDGLIQVPCTPGGIEQYLGEAPEIPVIELGAHSSSPSLDAVFIDERQGINELIDHLVELGHRRIAFLTGRQELHLIQTRASAFRLGVMRAGLNCEESPIIYGPASPSWFRQAVIKLLDAPHPPTALLLGNRQIAIGALLAFEETGVRVPEQLSAVALSDEDFYAISQPALTSFDYPFREMGMMAAQLLLERLHPRAESDHGPRIVQLSGQLRVRHSTAAPEKAAARRMVMSQ